MVVTCQFLRNILKGSTPCLILQQLACNFFVNFLLEKRLIDFTSLTHVHHVYGIFHMSNWKLSNQRKREVKLCLSKCESHLTLALHSSLHQESSLTDHLGFTKTMIFMPIQGIEILPLGKIVKRLLRIKFGQSPTLILIVLIDKLT